MNDAIIWEFNPIEDSLDQLYYLTIKMPDNNQKNIRLELLPTAQKEYFVQINNEAIDGKALSFFTESKFASPQEKMQILYQRLMTYKPLCIRLLFFPALLLAFALRFLLEWTLAQSAFWTTRVGAINQIYFVLMLFLSGQFAPMTLLPQPVQIAAYILPFRWIISFPIELISGRLTPNEALAGIGFQVAWLLISYVLFRMVWRSGVKVYTAVGA